MLSSRSGCESTPPSRTPGEFSPPTPIRRQPRRTAAVAAAIVSSVPPEQDTAITRSAAPTQAGSW